MAHPRRQHINRPVLHQAVGDGLGSPTGAKSKPSRLGRRLGRVSGEWSAKGRDFSAATCSRIVRLPLFRYVNRRGVCRGGEASGSY